MYSMAALYHRLAHSSTGKPVVFCLRLHKNFIIIRFLVAAGVDVIIVPGCQLTYFGTILAIYTVTGATVTSHHEFTHLRQFPVLYGFFRQLQMQLLISSE
jgi:hypothetical protein